jgi:hypothetical protein
VTQGLAARVFERGAFGRRQLVRRAVPPRGFKKAQGTVVGNEEPCEEGAGRAESVPRPSPEAGAADFFAWAGKTQHRPFGVLDSAACQQALRCRANRAPWSRRRRARPSAPCRTAPGSSPPGALTLPIAVLLHVAPVWRPAHKSTGCTRGLRAAQSAIGQDSWRGGLQSARVSSSTV